MSPLKVAPLRQQGPRRARVVPATVFFSGEQAPNEIVGAPQKGRSVETPTLPVVTPPKPSFRRDDLSPPRGSTRKRGVLPPPFLPLLHHGRQVVSKAERCEDEKPPLHPQHFPRLCCSDHSSNTVTLDKGYKASG
ncbi:hypothetical protein MRX96_037285 [Rhipicephalus microplus]